MTLQSENVKSRETHRTFLLAFPTVPRVYASIYALYIARETRNPSRDDTTALCRIPKVALQHSQSIPGLFQIGPFLA